MDTPRSETKSKNTERTNIKEDFSVVFEKQFSVIYNYVYARILHHERTEDLVSEVFIKAMKHYDSYNPSIASVIISRAVKNSILSVF